MLQTTMKKERPLSDNDPELGQMMEKMFVDTNKSSKLNEFQFFENHISTLVKFLSLVNSRRAARPKWTDVYMQSLQTCLNLKRHDTLIFHFKAVKSFWKTPNRGLGDLVSSLVTLNDKYSKHLSQQSWPTFELGEILIDYNIKVQDDKKLHFLEKVIRLQCQYFITQHPSHEELFRHYLMYFKGVGNINIFLFATDSYLKFVKNQSDEFTPKISIFLIVRDVLDYFQANNCQSNQVLQFVGSIFMTLAFLLQKPKYAYFLKELNQSLKMPNHLFIERIFWFIQKIDCQDTNNLLKDFIFSMIYSRQQQAFMIMMDPIVYLQPNCSLSDTFRYLASLLHYVRQIKHSVSKEKLEVFSRTTQHNIKLINSFEHTKQFKNAMKYYWYLYMELTNLQKKLNCNNISSDAFNDIESFAIQSGSKFIKFAPLYDLLITIGNLHRQPRHEQVHRFNMEYKLYILIITYIKEKSKKIKTALFNYLGHQFLPYFRTQFLPYQSYVHILCIFSKLTLSPQFQEVASKCFFTVTKVISISHYPTEYSPYGYGMIFSIMSQLKLQRQDRGDFLNKKCIFAADVVIILTKDLIKSFQEYQRKNTLNIWTNYLQKAFETLFYYYQDIVEEQIENLFQQITEILDIPEFSEAITSITISIAFKLIRQQRFFQQSCQDTFYNVLSFFQEIYLELKGQLKMRESIKFIDFCFNMNLDIFNLFYSQANGIQRRMKTIEQLKNKIDEIQRIILERSASKFISNLFQQSISENDPETFLDVLSISIKSIFFIVHEQKFISKLTQKRMKPQQQLNIEQELQETMTKLLSVRQKCNQILPYFNRIYNDWQSVEYVGPIEIKEVKISSHRSTLPQCNDLMYIASLCGVDQLKDILISIRLSLISFTQPIEVFLLELSKYYFLGIFKRTDAQLLQYIQRHSRALNRQSQYKKLIDLLINDKIIENQQISSRYFKTIYLMKQNGIVFFKNYKNFSSYFYAYLFQGLPLNLEKQNLLMKASRDSQRYTLKDKQYWTKKCWQQGWILTRLVIMINQQILQTAININQTSKIRSFHKFALLFCIRSAHIAELKTPLMLSLKNNKKLSLVKIVDSLRRLQSHHINKEAYRQIDKMIISKRKSISMPHQQSNNRFNQISKLYNKIESAFSRCVKTRVILSEIFCHIASQQANLNIYQAFLHKSLLPTIASTLSKQEKDLSINLKPKTRSFEQQISFIQHWKDRLFSLIFFNYPVVLIIKDFISEFIDEALNEDNIEALSPAQHRLIDQIITTIGLAFQQLNYAMKKMIFRLPNVNIKQLTFHQIANQVDQTLKLYQQYAYKYPYQITKQLVELKSSPYPVSMIFPLGSNTFTVSFNKKLLVTYTNRNILEDRLISCQTVIQSNERFLKDHESLNKKVDKRVGLDRQLGKMCENMDIGIFDINFQLVSKDIYYQCQRIDLNILKFALNQPKVINRHFQVYAKRYKLGKCYNLASLRQRLKYKPTQNQNLLIFLHEKYLQFPFQLIKSVRRDIGVYRLPSIQYLLQNQHKRTEYSINRCKYLVNTKNDLKETQQRFEKIKSCFNEWMGIKGKLPQLNEVQILLDRQVYLYMGHGTGLQHLRDEDISMLQPLCPMLVFGCCSAKMVFDSTQPFGSAFTLLLRGCPAYLGCLWSVTDFDIDLVTQEIFINNSNSNLSLVLEAARKKCFYPYINGSSTVVYGLPIRLKK